MSPTLSHAIPRRHRLTTPQKPHDSNSSVSNSEMLSWELHATFVELHPLLSITPDQWALHPIRAGASPLMRCTIRSATSDSADTRQGQLGPRQQARHYEPHHRPEASHNASHRSAVSTKPQWRLLLSGVTPLRGHYTSSEMVQCSLTGVMLPNWCIAARHGSADILLEQLWSKSSRA